jgi:uncharacterized protein
MKVFMNTLLTVLVLLSFALKAEAKDFPSPPLTYVYDESNTLNQETVNSLHQKLSQFEAETTNQVVVAVFKSLDGENLEDYTNRLFKEWKVGQKGKNNGVLLTLFLAEHKMRIEVGYGLEPILTDAKSKETTSRYIVPFVKRQDLNGAVLSGVDQILAVIKKAPTEEATASQGKDMIPSLDSLYLILIGILVIVLVLYLIRRNHARILQKKKLADDANERDRVERQKLEDKIEADRYEATLEKRRLKAAQEKEDEKNRLLALYPKLSYEAAKDYELKLKAEQQKKESDARLMRKWAGLATTLAAAMLLEKEQNEEDEKQRIKESIEKARKINAKAEENEKLRRRNQEENEKSRKRNQEENKRRKDRDNEDSSSNYYQSSSSSDSSSDSGFSGGGGESGGGGSSDSW